jgi:hypothetical protein
MYIHIKFDFHDLIVSAIAILFMYPPLLQLNTQFFYKKQLDTQFFYKKTTQHSIIL